MGVSLRKDFGSCCTFPLFLLIAPPLKVMQLIKKSSTAITHANSADLHLFYLLQTVLKQMEISLICIDRIFEITDCGIGIDYQ